MCRAVAPCAEFVLDLLIAPARLRRRIEAVRRGVHRVAHIDGKPTWEPPFEVDLEEARAWLASNGIVDDLLAFAIGRVGRDSNVLAGAWAYVLVNSTSACNAPHALGRRSQACAHWGGRCEDCGSGERRGEADRT
jgi:hypothetical protein